jgi:hypothetical protein
MFVRIVRVVVIVALVMACYLTSIRVSKAAKNCIIIGANCVDDGCGATGGECTEYPSCFCQHIGRPPE